jgi:hypothetical protein
MVEAFAGDSLAKDCEATIAVGSSEALPLGERSVDFVLSSPPYCTRIDYAVATLPELAVLGYRIDTEFDELRRSLIGTSTVPKEAPSIKAGWGKTCRSFLEQLENHTSKASESYYLKNHLQYFNSLYISVSEISRTLRPKGACILVVQDSFYKDIHNDLPKIVSEMAVERALSLERQENFGHSRVMAGVNPKVKKYRAQVTATESVLCFSRN